MQEETGVPAENLRGRVWSGNQTHERRGDPGDRTTIERRVFRPPHKTDLPTCTFDTKKKIQLSFYSYSQLLLRNTEETETHFDDKSQGVALRKWG